MVTRRCLLLVLLGLSVLVSVSRATEPATLLKPVSPFFELKENSDLFGPCSAVAVARTGEVIVFHRGKRPLLVFSARGDLVRSWGDDLIGSAHGLRVDHNNDIWVTDVGRHRVHKFDLHGKLLLSLGTGKPGAGDDEFNKPTDIAVAPHGQFFVTDGYGNTRVLKFDRQGKLLAQWGRPGKAAGDFNLPHSIVRDAKGRLLVGDRENNRVQVFNQDGEWLATWPGFAPYGLELDARGRLYVADARAHQLLRLAEDGTVERRWGRKGSGPGEFDLPHMLAFDQQGNLYVAEVNGRRVQKFAAASLE